MKNIFIAIIATLFITSCGQGEWDFKTKLPNHASEIKEFIKAEEFIPDYKYFLSAKITKAEFLNYTNGFKMKLHTDTTQYSDDIVWLTTESNIEWWNSKSQKDSMYVSQNGQEWVIARYIDEKLYLNAHMH